MGQQITGNFVPNKNTSISPQQKWARRRNWEKRTLKNIHEELDFRLNIRWKENTQRIATTGKYPGVLYDLCRTQTATDKEIKTMEQIISLMDSLIEKWPHNHGTMKKNINFKNFK